MLQARVVRVAVVLAVAGLLGAASVYSALVHLLPHNPLTPVRRSVLSLVIPEGWGFFTRDPRESDLFVYVPGNEPGQWLFASNVPNANWRNLFGLNRASRGQGMEMALLVNAVGRDDWRHDHACGSEHSRCLDSVDSSLPITNDTPNASLCGVVGIVVQEPVPWAWSGIDVAMPARVARLNVECER